MTSNNPAGRRGRANPPEHGTRARYRSEAAPCSCSTCRAANAAYERRRRVTLRAGIAPAYGRQLPLPLDP